MANTENGERNPILSRTRELQSEIHTRLFQSCDSTHQTHEEGHTIQMDQRPGKCVSSTKENVNDITNATHI